MKVTHGFVSFTEVEAGHHRSYNEWHLFDHLPEQLPLTGVVWGQRWVLTPELRIHCVAAPPLDRIHYVTLYLLAEPIETTMSEFRALGARLRELGRFHQHRTSHLSGALRVESCHTSDRLALSAEAVPYRPNTGVHIRLEGGNDIEALLAMPGVAGAWTFTDGELRATWAWLDGDPVEVDACMSPPAHARFAGTLAAVDPRGPWDWFD